MAELKRELGLIGATNVGIGNIIGAGIFVLSGIAAGQAGPGVVFSFLIAGFITLLTALSCAELSSFITDIGGPICYTRTAFGHFPGFLVGWVMIFDYIIGASAVCIGFGFYFLLLFSVPLNTVSIVLVAVSVPIIITVLNIRGLKEASNFNTIMVLVKILGLALFIIVGGYFLLTNGNYGNYAPMFPTGMSGILSGTSIVFFAFIGFYTITTISEEVKDPARTIPRAILISVLASTIIYVSVAIVEVGLVNWHLLGESAAPLEIALRAATSNQLLIQFVTMSALFAIISVVMASIIGSSRSLLALARKNVMPQMFCKISSRGVPILTVLISGGAITSIIVVSGGNIEQLASAFNFGALLSFVFINLSLVKLRMKMPDCHRPFRTPLYPFTPLVATGASIFLMCYLDMNAILIGSVWMVIGGVVYMLAHKMSRVKVHDGQYQVPEAWQPICDDD